MRVLSVGEDAGNNFAVPLVSNRRDRAIKTDGPVSHGTNPIKQFH